MRVIRRVIAEQVEIGLVRGGDLLLWEGNPVRVVLLDRTGEETRLEVLNQEGDRREIRFPSAVQLDVLWREER